MTYDPKKMKTEEIIYALKKISVFEPVQDVQLRWMAERGTTFTLAEGDYLFKKGDPVDYMFVLLKGGIQMKVLQGKQFKNVQRMQQGEVTGILPYSRMQEATGFGMAYEPAMVFSLHKKHFQEMEQRCHDLVKALVAVMTTRARDFTRRQQQDDKMMALGKLSAGLAHELNNPASAIIRSASTLKQHLQQTPESFKQIISVNLEPGQVDDISELLFQRINQPPINQPNILERSQQEDEIAEWLEDLSVRDPFELAETMVDFGFDVSDLEEINEICRGQYLAPILRWLDNVLTTEKMVNDIELASTRISDLVHSVKTYTHMDRGADMASLNIHEGLDSTLTMLSHKLKQKHIQVIKKYADNLPEISGFVSELNQVWTNLIDNAIDAMEEGGKLIIRTLTSRDHVEVQIEDNGNGIPPEMVGHIFTPFFTTKEVGKGTGMGLDIVKKILDQHQAQVDVSSEPGSTVFSICFKR